MAFQPIGDYGGRFKRPPYLDARNIRGGVITAQEVVIAGGTKGAIRSQNFVSGTTGWAIYGDGSAEFDDLTARGTFYLTSGQITGQLDLDGSGSIVTDTTGKRVEITSAEDDRITWIDSTGDEAFIGFEAWPGWYIVGPNYGGRNPLTGFPGFRWESTNGDMHWGLISSSGGSNVSMEMDSLTGLITVNKDLTFSNAANPSLFLPSGTASDPGAAWTADLDTGFYLITTAEMGASIAGSLVQEWTAQGVGLSVNGSAASPSIYWDNDIDTGFYRPDADGLEAATGGVRRFRISLGTSLFYHDLELITGSLRIDNDEDILFEYADGTNTWAITVDTGDDFRIQDHSGNSRFALLDGGAADGDVAFFNAAAQEVYRWDQSQGRHEFSDAGTLIVVMDAAYGSGLGVRENLTDIGNHETLRADRTASGTAMTEVGYYSSYRALKKDIEPLWQAQEWDSDNIDRVKPVKYRRKATNEREFGFILEDLAEISPFLTTKGEQVGHSPDEYALLAVAIDAIQQLRRRVEQLEAAIR